LHLIVSPKAILEELKGTILEDIQQTVVGVFLLKINWLDVYNGVIGEYIGMDGVTNGTFQDFGNNTRERSGESGGRSISNVVAKFVGDGTGKSGGGILVVPGDCWISPSSL
jgi:hypothetical protein